MTARRLHRKNKPDVARFLYVPLPIATVSFVWSGTSGFAVECRDWPRFAANHRNVVRCRIVSQIVVICRLEYTDCFQEVSNSGGVQKKYPESLQELSTLEDQRKVERKGEARSGIFRPARGSPTKCASTRPGGPSEIPLVSRGPFSRMDAKRAWRRRETANFLVPRGLRHSLIKCGELPESTVSDKHRAQNAGLAKFLVRKTLRQSLIC